MNLIFGKQVDDKEHIKNGDTIHFKDGTVRCRICGENKKMNWPITLDQIGKMQSFIESFGDNHIKCIKKI